MILPPLPGLERLTGDGTHSWALWATFGRCSAAWGEGGWVPVSQNIKITKQTHRRNLAFSMIPMEKSGNDEFEKLKTNPPTHLKPLNTMQNNEGRIRRMGRMGLIAGALGHFRSARRFEPRKGTRMEDGEWPKNAAGPEAGAPGQKEAMQGSKIMGRPASSGDVRPFIFVEKTRLNQQNQPPMNSLRQTEKHKMEGEDEHEEGTSCRAQRGRAVMGNNAEIFGFELRGQNLN